MTYRQLTNSAAGKNDGGSIDRNKFLEHINVLWKSKMSMQNHSKLLVQLKDYWHKSGYDKSLQIVLSKDWIDFLQRITYAQINTLRKLSPMEFMKSTSDNKTADIEKYNNKEIENKKVILVAKEEETLVPSPSKHRKVCQVLYTLYTLYFP